jgi:hypothetical protein
MDPLHAIQFHEVRAQLLIELKVVSFLEQIYVMLRDQAARVDDMRLMHVFLQNCS